MATVLDELRVLVVEDDDFQRKMTVRMFQTLGVSWVNAASNGREALELIRAEGGRQLDVVVCDLNMPEMDGLELLRHLGEGSHDIAVIITSSLSSSLIESAGKMSKLYGVRLLGVIEKPIIPDSIRGLLEELSLKESKPSQSGMGRNFSLEEILQGICDGQFEPYFQPKVDVQTGRLTGAEALARWNHPVYGVVGPDLFIPQLEQSRSIDELTFLMLEKAAIACKNCHGMGHPITVSVNLSLVSLDDTGLADKIRRIVATVGLDPRYMALEVTESVAMNQVAHALENLSRLRMSEFGLSIDDYGTGYSGMQQLMRIPFSELKIDQSFVKDFTGKKALRVAVESSIDMAHKLHLKSVAEGVETREEWDALKEMGCNTIQGYFIARPMSEPAFYNFVKQYNSRLPQKAASPGKALKETCILIVDDDPIVRKLIKMVLKDIGFNETFEADCAESALRLLDNGKFDLVITDVNMPGMTGLEFARQIRIGKSCARADTRIVLLTSHSCSDVLSKALALDVNGFLVKPVTAAAVGEKIKQAMSESLHLRVPLAYESVNVDLLSVKKPVRPPVDFRSSAAAIRVDVGLQSDSQVREARRISLRRLRPGMVLQEDIRLEDGTLLLSGGHVLTELSLNRLNELRALLPETDIAVQEAV